MKKLFILLAIAGTSALTACNNSDNHDNAAHTEGNATTENETSASGQVVAGEYVDLSTGEKVSVIPDKETGHAVNKESEEPIEFYVNTNTNDTLFKTGVVVNNQLINTNGKWQLDETKVELDGDEIKIKDENSKLKAEDGDLKYKEGEDNKIKIEKDGDAKYKNGDTKTKVDEDGEVKTKRKD